MIYLDYGATSWPKSEKMLNAMTDFMRLDGGSPSKSGHVMSVKAYNKIISARKNIASFFGLSESRQLIFLQNATAALSTVILGYIKSGDRVIISSVEHNSVLRPILSHGSSIDLVYNKCSNHGILDLDNLKKNLLKKTKLVIVTHANNVNGTIQNIAEISKIVHDAGSHLLVDCAQTAGQIEIDAQKMGIDLLAFTGHKSLHGPPGIGGLIIGKDFDFTDLNPLILGAIGEDMDMPHKLSKFHSGTFNAPGIMGLSQAVTEIKELGLTKIREHLNSLKTRLREGLSNIDGVTVYGLSEPEKTTAIIPITIKGINPTKVAEILDKEFGICCRAGLHQAQLAHKTLGTYPEGTVRLAPGNHTTTSDIDRTIEAIKSIARRS